MSQWNGLGSASPASMLHATPEGQQTLGVDVAMSVAPNPESIASRSRGSESGVTLTWLRGSHEGLAREA